MNSAMSLGCHPDTESNQHGAACRVEGATRPRPQQDRPETVEDNGIER